MKGGLYLLKNISRVFGRRKVLSIDSLSIEPGRIYGLLGPNGSGKTTLMKIMAFLDEPGGGEIYFQGLKVTRRDMAALRAKVVWSPQFPVMFTGSLQYNIEYPMRIKGVPAAPRRRRAKELLDMVGLSDLAGAPAHRLSGGEAQRASLARALAAQAEVLLLDEPTANVDAASRQGLVRLIEDLRREGNLSIVITTHDLSLESELCQKRIYLYDGKLVSVHEATVHKALLSRKDDGFHLELPPEAGISQGLLSIQEVAANGAEVLLKLVSEDRRHISVRLEGETARQLSLSEKLAVRPR